MWKVYKYNGHYIMGDLISSHKTQSAALKKAKKEIDFKFSEREKKNNQIFIWLDDEKHSPMGVIVHKTQGTKRLRQDNEEEECKQVRYGLNSSNIIVANNNTHYEASRLAA